jgi:hypothetical protein
MLWLLAPHTPEALMTPDETIELGRLMERYEASLFHFKPSLSEEEFQRMRELQKRVKLELPTGETEIAQALRVDVEWKQRWGDLGRYVEKLGKEAAELIISQVVSQIPAMIEAASKPK